MSPPKKRKHTKDTNPSTNQEPLSTDEPEPFNPASQRSPSTDNSPKTFHDLGLPPVLCKSCTSLGYKTPTPIQTQCIPLALSGRDIIGLAETESGKTAAFVLPILQALLDKSQRLHSLILAPTRELAQQTANVVKDLGCSGICFVPAVDRGDGYGFAGDIVGEKAACYSRDAGYLVLDEAGRLLDCDFGPALDKILEVLPGRMTCLFSATMSSKVESLQRASLMDPVRVSVSAKSQTSATLLQYYALVPFKWKDVHFIHLLNEHAGQMTIIFTRIIRQTQRLAIMLRNLGFPAIPIHGQLSQSARLASLNKFRARSQNILIATDVAACGLDIPSVDLVVNYDLPEDSKTYIHRVGRTARAGRSGIAISIVAQYDTEIYSRIEAVLGKKLKGYEIPEDEAMLFAERVNEAQRAAAVQLREQGQRGQSSKKRQEKQRRHGPR
ncbi:ATP-dependent rRNA helicase rrp3 [Aspergillus cristatus]|uniref:RNA helicase n=1 Tax=Aspergillus cristatus TaxID=573508 RepID=A0A1E3BT83_ASPCR|nr:ATP-dependent rRNA helicase rrp3 [Aspergillus cristatus]ODM24517.1 ATP-dependent rRNA helicase rrp3 [Aspergillus cristatus]